MSQLVAKDRAPNVPRQGNLIERLNFYLVQRPALARKGVLISLTAFCDSRTTFEGHNRVVAGAKLINSQIGMASYVGPKSLLTNTRVGRFTCIGPSVDIIIGTHPTNFASIHPAFFSTRKQSGFTFSKTDLYPEFGEGRSEEDFLVEIGSDVWIGYGARIMQGVKIGHGAVIAAGSIVTKDVAPYTIVAGIPARPLRQRFPEATIRRLLDTAWWQLDFEAIARLAPYFSNPDLLLQELEKVPTPHS